MISCAPIGIYGLVSNTFATEGFGALVGYVQLLAVLLGCMFFVALVFNPLLVWFCIRRNPYPLTLLTLRESGVMAFFTRSSAANIPVNLELCRKLQLSQDTYSVSIPLGATINMAGAAITITVLALSACTTLGVHVDFLTAVLLAVVASLCAWLAAFSESTTTQPCRLWPSALSSVCCRIRARQRSILRPMRSLRQRLAYVPSVWSLKNKRVLNF